jgi:tetratricopeptide (TPR) repeat protein
MTSSFRFAMPVLRFVFLAGFLAFCRTAPANARQATDDERAEARVLLNKGVQAYRTAQFDEAADDFKRAKELDPSLLNAPLYLATTYASQYIPGAPSAENIRYGEQAVQEFREILGKDPNNLSAIDGLGSILYNMGSTPFDLEKINESKSYHQKHIEIQPKDPDAYYWVGVIDWAIAFRANRDLRSEYNARAEHPIGPADPMAPVLSARFERDYSAVVDEGISELKKAIDLKPDYDDAMAYLNLLYRQKADMEGSAAQRNEDLRMADDLVDQVKAWRLKRAGSPSPYIH